MIARKNADELAVWLAKNQPAVFEALLRGQVRGVLPGQHSLAGISDTLASLGTTFGTAVKSVGSFLSSEDGIKTLGTLGGVYLQSQMQRDALRLQTASVQAGYPPQPIQTAQGVPVYTPTGQLLTPSLAQRLTPQSSLLRDYLPWGVAFAVALAFLYVSRPR